MGEFIAVKMSRLNEALLVSFGAMSGANLRSTSEDRARTRPLSGSRRRSAGNRNAPQAPQKPRFGSRNGAGPAALRRGWLGRGVGRRHRRGQHAGAERVARRLASPLGRPRRDRNVFPSPGCHHKNLILSLSKDDPVGGDLSARWTPLREAQDEGRRGRLGSYDRNRNAPQPAEKPRFGEPAAMQGSFPLADEGSTEPSAPVADANRTGGERTRAHAPGLRKANLHRPRRHRHGRRRRSASASPR